MPHRALRQTDHRDLPLPSRPWAVSMRWADLMFMHWPVEPDLMRQAVPGDLDLDLYDGAAWLGVVPFTMQATRPRCAPAIPKRLAPVSASHFPELNVRTYVTFNTKDGPLPGVYFFSLDAASRLAVRVGRRGFGLAYFDAAMRVQREPGDSGWVHFQSQRTHFGAPPARFAASYRAVPGTRPAPPRQGTLEHFLTERYRFFASGRRGRGVRAIEVAHEPWPLRSAECDVSVCELTAGLGLEPPAGPPRAHFVDRLDVVAWRGVRAKRR